MYAKMVVVGDGYDHCIITVIVDIGILFTDYKYYKLLDKNYSFIL